VPGTSSASFDTAPAEKIQQVVKGGTHMKRQLYIGMALLAAAIIAGGCVSSGTFKKMEASKNDEIAALQRDKAALEQQKTVLEKNSAAQKEKIDYLTQYNDSVQREIVSVNQEKEALVAANQQRQKQYEALVQGLAKEVEKGQLQVRQYKNMLSVDLAEKVFFDSGKAALKKEGKDVLKKVGEALKGYDDKIIRVVGHTDNVKLAKSLQATYPTNWDLSVARASTVVRFLQGVGIPPERMIPAGRGEYDPVASNDTPEGRQKNRRIEIMLLDKSLISEMARTAN
jgi:chemotaxis protein MotB